MFEYASHINMIDLNGTQLTGYGNYDIHLLIINTNEFIPIGIASADSNNGQTCYIVDGKTDQFYGFL